MHHEFVFHHRRFVVKEGDDCAVVSIYDTRKDELASKTRLPRAESAFLMDLLKSRYEPIDAPANTATNLRCLLGDPHAELVENIRHCGYRLAVTAESVPDRMAAPDYVPSSSCSIDRVDRAVGSVQRAPNRSEWAARGHVSGPNPVPVPVWSLEHEVRT